ncbi:MAG TPA: hypothetical protein VFI65_09885 [Streptosporangiaceae bacterium]|nr:hypothetical protein [Streptosporangiaceae bacterium]
MPGIEKLPRTSREFVEEGFERGKKAGRPIPIGPQSGGGGSSLDIGGKRDDGGLENADQKQLDRELAATGRQERTGLPDKPEAGGGAKMDKGTSLPDSTTPGKTQS